jgi:hypothetical protein
VGADGDSLAGVAEGKAAVDLYWLPLGAGGHFVRFNGRAYEAVAARLHGVRRAISTTPRSRYVIEQAPVHDWSGKDRGSRRAGRFRIFRYEIRLWLGGNIPDVAEAVDSPQRLTTDEDHARRVLDVVAQIPTPVWGRDELGTGEMWNSNSVIAWVIARSGVDTASIQPPTRGPRTRLAGRAAGRASVMMARSCCFEACCSDSRRR